MDRELAPLGLAVAQLGLMAQIAAADDDTLGALARRTGHDPSTLSRNLRSLERAGFVEIAVVEKDLRRRAVWLTEKGARRLESAIPAWEKAQNEIARLISADIARRLAKSTDKLASS